jgi:hypothetical protein
MYVETQANAPLKDIPDLWLFSVFSPALRFKS